MKTQSKGKSLFRGKDLTILPSGMKGKKPSHILLKHQNVRNIEENPKRLGWGLGETGTRQGVRTVFEHDFDQQH